MRPVRTQTGLSSLDRSPPVLTSIDMIIVLSVFNNCLCLVREACLYT